MPIINNDQKVVHCKITYWGPHLSGKSTSIAYIDSKMNGKPWEPDVAPFEPSLAAATRRLQHSNVVAVTHDYMSVNLGELRGYKLAFGLYGPTGLPGGLFPQARASRKLMAKSTDVFVFVASSMPQDQESNLASLDELRSLEDAADATVIFQLNKQDLPGAMSPDVLKSLLDIENELILSSVATQGIGVFDTLKAASKVCLVKLTR